MADHKTLKLERVSLKLLPGDESRCPVFRGLFLVIDPDVVRVDNHGLLPRLVNSIEELEDMGADHLIVRVNRQDDITLPTKIDNGVVPVVCREHSLLVLNNYHLLLEFRMPQEDVLLDAADRTVVGCVIDQHYFIVRVVLSGDAVDEAGVGQLDVAPHAHHAEGQLRGVLADVVFRVKDVVFREGEVVEVG